MAVTFKLTSRAVRRLLSVVMIGTLVPGNFAWGALQPRLGQVTNPVFGTPGGTVPSAVPPNLSPYIKDVTAAIQLGKALFWDMQAGSDGFTACASCHYRAGADPIAAPVFDRITSHKRNKNQLHPGPDTIFGNNSTLLRTFDLAAPAVPVLLRATGFPLYSSNLGGPSRFSPNYTLVTSVDVPLNPLGLPDFPLFFLNPPAARLSLVNPVSGFPDPVNGLTNDAVLSLRDTNDVVGSQGIRLAQFDGIGAAVDVSTPLTDQLFHIGVTDPANNIRQVTGRNAPSVINAVFNYTNMWDGRANNTFNGSSPFGPLDQNAGIWIDDNVDANLVKQKIAIPNSSLASQAVGQAVGDVEMSFRGRTFPELGRKMLALAPLATQFVHPGDSVLGTLSQDPNGDRTGNPGIDISVSGPGDNTYRTMIKSAFVDTLWNSNKTVTLDTNRGAAQFTQIEANFSLFWGLAIQLYEATLVSDRTPFDSFQAGNKNALNTSEQAGFSDFDSKCTICHTGTEFSSAVVGSTNCPVTTPFTDCNRVSFTNNSSHNLIRQDVNPATLTDPKLIDTGFFNIGVRPTVDDPGRGGSALGFPLSFSRLAVQTGLPFVTPKLSLPLPDKVQGSFKTPGLRNIELTPPYFHNGEAVTLEQVVEFFTRGGSFPNNPELAANQLPIGNLRSNSARRANIVAFMKKLTDERVRNETAPFDHPELTIPNGVDDNGNDLLITLAATGGTAPDVAITTLTIDPVVSPTNLTTLVISGAVDDTATVAVDVSNTTTGTNLPKATAAVAGTTWSVTLTGLAPGSYTITATATSSTGTTTLAGTGAPAVVTGTVLVTPTATISGTPLGGRTNQNSATLTIGGNGVVSYQYSLDGAPYSADRDILTTPAIALTGLSDGTHTVAVLARDTGGNQQPSANATTSSWTVKATPPVLTLDAIPPLTGNSTVTIGGTVEVLSLPTVSVDTGATIGLIKTVSGISTDSWSCDISGLAPGTNTITVVALDSVFNETTVTSTVTRILPDGDLDENGVTDIRDALKALRIAVELELPTDRDVLHGDIAPLVDGKITRNNLIDIGDALLILRKITGLAAF